jgi:hypothetical protein
MGLALQLISMASPETWANLWPAIKQALAGVSAGSLLFVAGRAAESGLKDLAERIKAFEPVATPDDPSLPDDPYLVQYQPLENWTGIAKAIDEGDNVEALFAKKAPTVNLREPQKEGPNPSDSGNKFRMPNGNLNPEIISWLATSTAAVDRLGRWLTGKVNKEAFDVVMKIRDWVSVVARAVENPKVNIEWVKVQTDYAINSLRGVWESAGNTVMQVGNTSQRARDVVKSAGEHLQKLQNLLEKLE